MSRATKISRKTRELRATLWPDVNFKTELWDRHTDNGFITVPRTMPLIISIIDDLTKGAPAGSTYLELWCRSFDEMYVSLSKQRELAFNSGFIGQRAERTWGDKIRKLDALGFISVKGGQAGPLSHALIFNPYFVIRRLRESGHAGVSKDKFNALVERAIEIGATHQEPAPVVEATEDAKPDAKPAVGKLPTRKKPVPSKSAA